MSNGKRTTLTKTIMNAMKEGEEIWDNDVTGLLVRAGARGKSFLYSYTTLQGKRRKLAIGITSLDMARAKAKAWRDMVRDGVDPAQALQAEREKVPPSTLKDIEQRWEIEAAKSEKWWNVMKGKQQNGRGSQKQSAFSFMKPSTIAGYRSYWKHILIFFGETKEADTLTLLDVQNFHLHLSTRKRKEVKHVHQSGKEFSIFVRSGGPVAANHALLLLSTALQAAVRWGMLPDEASIKFMVMFKKIDKNPEFGRTRYLAPHEMPMIEAGLANLRNSRTKKGHKKGRRTLHEDSLRADLIEIWLWTASRHSEFMSARLSWIEWDGPVKFLKLWDSKTGAKNIELGDRVIDILKRRCEEWHAAGGRPGDDKDWILPSARKKGSPAGKSYKGWRTFLESCGLDTNIVPHNIRHTVLTHAVHSAGLGLEQAAGIATHSDMTTTAGYVQKVSAANVIALNKTNSVMRSMMDGTFKMNTQDDNVPAYMKADREKLQEAAAI